MYLFSTKNILLTCVLCLSSTVTLSAEKKLAKNKIIIKKPLPAEDPNDVFDQRIRNNRLRAEAGKKRNWSFNADIKYHGASVENIFGDTAPNPEQQPVAPRVKLAGALGVAYRLTAMSYLKARGGFSVIQPFHNFDKLEFFDPELKYTLSYLVGSWQMSTNIIARYYTQKNERAIGTQNELGYFHSMLYNPRGSNWTLGLITEGWTRQYDKEGIIVPRPSSPDNLVLVDSLQVDYSFGFYPVAEYRLTDSTNIRSVLGLAKYWHLRPAQQNTYVKPKVYQTMGVGVSLTRDIYIYPYIHFIPEQIKPELMTFNFHTIMNL